MERRARMEEYLRSLDAYLRQQGSPSLEGLLLARGRWFEGRSDADAFEAAARWKREHRPRAKDCYFNAQQFCIDEPAARYVEGYALASPGGLPVEHAWVVWQDRVIDVTFEAMERKARRSGLVSDTHDALYLGLEVPRSFVLDEMTLQKAAQPLALAYYFPASGG